MMLEISAGFEVQEQIHANNVIHPSTDQSRTQSAFMTISTPHLASDPRICSIEAQTLHSICIALPRWGHNKSSAMNTCERDESLHGRHLRQRRGNHSSSNAGK